MRTIIPNRKAEKISLMIFFLLFLLVLAGCGEDSPFEGNVTPHSPTPSPTPTCPPDIRLSTPEGWKTTTRLTVVLFNPDSMGGQYLEMEDGEHVKDIVEFVKIIIPKLLGPSDHLAVFHLGFASYEKSRISNLGSDLSIPQFYNTPAPYDTVTPRPTPEKTPEAGMLRVQATQEAKSYQTQVAQINSENAAIYNCQTVLWNETAAADAAAWEVTKIARNTKIENETFQGFDDFSTEGIYRTDELKHGGLYYGLSFATVILDARCADYDECVILIIDDLSYWMKDNPDQLDIDLQGSKIYTIMPNCEDIDQPSCTELLNFWRDEFINFGSNPNVTFWNGKQQVETQLLKELRRQQ
jgi:hypothetical protein